MMLGTEGRPKIENLESSADYNSYYFSTTNLKRQEKYEIAKIGGGQQNI